MATAILHGINRDLRRIKGYRQKSVAILHGVVHESYKRLQLLLFYMVSI